jgi:hypothetical protein
MTQQTTEPKKSKRKATSGLFIPAGLFIGMGIGFVYNSLVAGLFIGLGAGFLLFALVMVLVKE